MKSALDFSNFIQQYFFDEDIKNLFLLYVEYAIAQKKDLWACGEWLKEIRRISAVQFDKKIDAIQSAVARLASMDTSERKKEEYKGIPYGDY